MANKDITTSKTMAHKDITTSKNMAHKSFATSKTIDFLKKPTKTSLVQKLKGCLKKHTWPTKTSLLLRLKKQQMAHKDITEKHKAHKHITIFKTQMLLKRP